MGLCNDKRLSFLKERGYSVIRHPNADVRPLGLIGVQDKTPIYLGPLNLLITNPPGPLPPVTKDTPAADLNGKASSSLKLGIGLSILGNLIGAMGGGNLAANLNFTNAKKVEFEYEDVLNDSVGPLEVGNYLRDGDVDAGNLVLKQYVMGNGQLYLITKIAKSKKFKAVFERSSGVGATVDVPVLQGVAGGNVSVETTNASSGEVSFEGPTLLTFAFQSFRVGVRDGELSLMNAKPGGVFLSVDETADQAPAVIPSDGLLELSLG